MVFNWEINFPWPIILQYVTSERRYLMLPDCRATCLEISPGRHRAEPVLWSHHRHHSKQWGAHGGSTTAQPGGCIPACEQTLWAGMLLLAPCAWTAGHAETPDSTFLWETWALGRPCFLLCHRDVTTRVGTQPRKTSFWTRPTLVQNTGSVLSAFPWDIGASVTLSRGPLWLLPCQDLSYCTPGTQGLKIDQ